MMFANKFYKLYLKNKLEVLALFCAIHFIMLNSDASEFRHKNAKQSNEGYKYVVIALSMPLSNSLNDVSALFNPDIYANSDYDFKNKDTYPNNKIGGMAGIGVKMPFFFRIEAKLDFLTFTRKIDKTISFDDVEYTDTQFIIRQFGPMVSLYLDLDNNTFFTPYIGGGGGFMFTQGLFRSYNDGSGILDSFLYDKEEKHLTNKGYLTYEMNAGLNLGSKAYSISIEGFVRKTPKIKLESRGVMVKVNFQI